MNIIPTSKLILPVEYVGGYLYARRVGGVIFGAVNAVVPTQRRCSSKYRDDAAEQAAIDLLQAAPVGVTYMVTHYRDPDQNWGTDENDDPIDESSIRYRKVADDQWEQIL